MTAPEIVKLLRAIADAIEQSGPEQVKAIIDNLSTGVKRSRQSAPELKRLYNSLDLSDIAKRLLAVETRQDGHAIIAGLKLTRRDLAQLGRNNSVHIVKEDNVATIEAKIVEALVGARLNSKAIRGDK